MGKFKVLSRFTAGAVALSCALAPVALSYSVPGTAGTPGGPPTKPKGGNALTKKGAVKLATGAAGNTGSELAGMGSVVVTIKVSKAGKLTGKMTAGSTTLGNGNATATSGGNIKLKIKFSNSGKSFLNSHNGQAIKVNVTCTFNPNSGKTQTSKSEVTLDA